MTKKLSFKNFTVESKSTSAEDKRQYDDAQRKLAVLAKERRLAKEAGKAWKANDKKEKEYYRLKDVMNESEAEHLDELSPGTLGRYVKKADKQATKASDSYSNAASRRSDFANDTPAMAKNAKKFTKRDAGAALARKKLANQNESVDLDEMFDKVHPTLKKELGSHAAHAVGMAGSDKGVAVSFDRAKDISVLRKQMSQHGYTNVTKIHDTSGKHKHTYHFSESVDLDEGKKGVVLAFKDQYKSRDGATDDGQRAMKKAGGSSFTVYKSSNGLWAYKVFEGVEEATNTNFKLINKIKKSGVVKKGSMSKDGVSKDPEKDVKEEAPTAADMKKGEKLARELEKDNPAMAVDRQLAAMRTSFRKTDEDCWDGYDQKGTKKKGDKVVPNCVKEDDEDLDEVLDIAQRRKAAMNLKKNKTKIAMGRERASRKIADMPRLKKRAAKQARNDALKKLTKGIPKSELTPARRAELEKRLNKMKPKLDRIAKKNLPLVRKAEIEKKRGTQSGDTE